MHASVVLFAPICCRAAAQPPRRNILAEKIRLSGSFRSLGTQMTTETRGARQDGLGACVCESLVECWALGPGQGTIPIRLDRWYLRSTVWSREVGHSRSWHVCDEIIKGTRFPSKTCASTSRDIHSIHSHKTPALLIRTLPCSHSGIGY